MRRTKSPLLAAILLGLCGGWMASCSDDESRECTPQETRVCAGVGRCVGVQACLPDGSGWNDCDCSGPPREGAGGTTGAEAPTPIVGRACTQSAECGEGLTCYTSTSNEFLGGGPSGGYCSASCSADADCAGVDRQSQCVITQQGAAGLCLRTCLSQDPTNAGENKCLGRYDLACNSVAFLGLEAFSGLRQDGWCYPQCASDEDCGARKCDLARGLCVDTPTAGLPIGSRCTANTDCSGRLCVGFTGGEAFCSAPCVLGPPIGCGYGTAPARRAAGCLLPQQSGFLSSEGIGDVGFCVELCADASQCTQGEDRGGWQCDLTEDAQTRFNTPGICDAPSPPDSGTDAATDASSTVPTPPTGDAG
jgi:hypothetical protein